VINSVIHHLGIGVENPEEAELFFDALLVDFLGMNKEKVDESAAGWKGRGSRIYLYKVNAIGKTHNLQHLAFTARSRDEVAAFPGWAKTKGISILSGPKEYPEYGGDYFAVFFHGPDKLKLEFVHLTESGGEVSQ